MLETDILAVIRLYYL